MSKSSNNIYILCIISPDGESIFPMGNGKSLDYALSLLKMYNENGRTGLKLYKLVEVKDELV